MKALQFSSGHIRICSENAIMALSISCVNKLVGMNERPRGVRNVLTYPSIKLAPILRFWSGSDASLKCYNGFWCWNMDVLSLGLLVFF